MSILLDVRPPMATLLNTLTHTHIANHITHTLMVVISTWTSTLDTLRNTPCTLRTLTAPSILYMSSHLMNMIQRARNTIQTLTIMTHTTTHSPPRLRLRLSSTWALRPHSTTKRCTTRKSRASPQLRVSSHKNRVSRRQRASSANLSILRVRTMLRTLQQNIILTTRRHPTS